MPSSSHIKEERERSILWAALRVIRKKGFHRSRMVDIAREAGISYGLVYHYYRNKEDLIEAVLSAWWDDLFDLMAEIIHLPLDATEKLSRLIQYFLDTYQDRPDLMKIFITEISRSTANLTEEGLEQFKKFMSLTEGVIAEGQAKNLLRNDLKARYLTYIFLGALETFISTMVLADQKIRGDAQKEKIAQSILEVFLNGARIRRGH